MGPSETSPAGWMTPSCSRGDSPSRSLASPAAGVVSGACEVGSAASSVASDGGRTCIGCSYSERIHGDIHSPDLVFISS